MLLWLVYLALEPGVRARWPQAMVTWSRMLAGQWRDSRVAAHVLIGAALGCSIWLIFSFIEIVAEGSGIEAGGDLQISLGTRQWIAAHAATVSGALGSGLVIFYVLFGFRLILKKDWVAAIAVGCLFAMMEGRVVSSPEWITMGLIYIAVYGILIFVLLRLGLLPLVASAAFINSFNSLTVAGDLRAWYAPAGLASLALLLSVTVIAFWRSLGTRPWTDPEDLPA
jgi:serine/threonine-protein kinase